jgi:hypothetical protein
MSCRLGVEELKFYKANLKKHKVKTFNVLFFVWNFTAEQAGIQAWLKTTIP